MIRALRCAAVGLLALSAACASDGWRRRPPAVEPSLTFVRPVVRRLQLANGLAVYVVKSSRVPLVTVEVCSLAGAVADPPDRPGLADVAWRAAAEGAGGLDAAALAAAFARLGSPPGVSVSATGAALGVTVKAGDAGAAVELLASLVQRPAFDDAGIERVKALRDDDLWQLEGNPVSMGWRALQALLFGEGHPAARPIRALREALQGITPAEVRAFHERWVAPNTTALVLAGDLTDAQARAHAERAFGAWKGQAALPPLPLPLVERAPGPPVVLHKEGLNQTLVLFGRAGVATGSADEAPLRIAAAFLRARLSEDLREQLQVTYGAGAGSTSWATGGILSGGSWVRASATSAAVEAALADVSKVREWYGSRSAKRDRAHGWMKAQLMRRTYQLYEGGPALARAAAQLFFRRLPESWYETGADEVLRVTADQVQSAVERFFDPKTMHVVLVGDPKALDGLRAGAGATR